MIDGKKLVKVLLSIFALIIAYIADRMIGTNCLHEAPPLFFIYWFGTYLVISDLWRTLFDDR